MTRRRTHRRDDNQDEIVKGLRKIPGVKVAVTSQVGGGFPDIVVGFQGRNYLMEIKDGAKIPSERKLSTSEQEFHRYWTGQIAVVENFQAALDVLGI